MGETGKSRAAPSLAQALWRVAAMAAVTGALFLFVQAQGASLDAPQAGGVADAAPAAAPDVLLHLLIALTAIIATGQLLARLFAYVHQPPVIGEVVAGILLGPSLIGPHLSALVLPPAVAPALGAIAQLGVVLYMFLVGLELNTRLLRRQAPAALIIAYAGMLAPFILGAALAVFLYPRVAEGHVAFGGFALFLGVAMSITAFPVLARILSDSGMQRSELGVLALGCAAIGDVTAWCVLALVVGVLTTAVGEGLTVATGAAAFVVATVFVARPLLRRFAARWQATPDARGAVTALFVALLLAALSAEAIGIHAIFGAFLLGAMIPHDSALARVMTERLEHVVTILLLPAFFAFTGMRTRIDLLTEPSQWLLCAVIIAMAVAGKVGGTALAARTAGLAWRDAATLGALMNTRGLMELIVLNVGLDLGVISPPLFAMMVLMALVTTMMTAPLVHLLQRRAPRPG